MKCGRNYRRSLPLVHDPPAPRVERTTFVYNLSPATSLSVDDVDDRVTDDRGVGDGGGGGGGECDLGGTVGRVDHRWIRRQVTGHGNHHQY